MHNLKKKKFFTILMNNFIRLDFINGLYEGFSKAYKLNGPGIFLFDNNESILFG